MCVLLGGELRDDARVLNTVRSLSQLGVVHVYYVGRQTTEGLASPGDRIRVFRCAPRSAWLARIYRHSFVHLEFEHLYQRVLESGFRYGAVHANDYTTLYPAARLAERLHARLVYDAHEIYMETLNQHFPLGTRGIRGFTFKALLGFMRSVGWRIESRLVRRVDLLLTVSESCCAFFRDRYDVADCRVVMNCPEPGLYQPGTRLRQRVQVSRATSIVLYQGVLNSGRGLLALLESARHLRSSAVLVLLGSGPLESELHARRAQLGLEGRVHFLPSVAYTELLSYTGSADVGVLLLEPINLSKTFALANKVFQYMAASLPLVLSRSPEHDRLLTEVGCGLATPSLSPQDIAATIDRVLSNRLQAEKMAQAGRLAFERKYNWQRQEEKLLQGYRHILNGTLGSYEGEPSE